jgi:hypothetical protein
MADKGKAKDTGALVGDGVLTLKGVLSAFSFPVT